MDLNINYYSALDANKNATNIDIKKSYYFLSKKYHPDVNNNIEDQSKFQLIAKAYSILSDEELKKEYDKKSRWGKDYSEFQELFKVDMEFDYSKENEKLEKFKNKEILDIIVKIDPDKFDGTLEYPRYVLCKSCKGSGKDLKSKIVIRDEKGNIKGMFDADDGCDFCDGTGKDSRDQDCGFCHGLGKIGMKDCNDCKGEKRILGKQKLSGIKLDGDETKVEAMGHLSSHVHGIVGNLILKYN